MQSAGKPGLWGQSLSHNGTPEERRALFPRNTSRFLFTDFMCMPITYATQAHHALTTLVRKGVGHPPPPPSSPPCEATQHVIGCSTAPPHTPRPPRIRLGVWGWERKRAGVKEALMQTPSMSLLKWCQPVQIQQHRIFLEAGRSPSPQETIWINTNVNMSK